MSSFVVPRYDGPTLAEVLPSVTARLSGEVGRLLLPEAARYVVFMVDGLGWEVLVEHEPNSPFHLCTK